MECVVCLTTLRDGDALLEMPCDFRHRLHEQFPVCDRRRWWRAGHGACTGQERTGSPAQCQRAGPEQLRGVRRAHSGGAAPTERPHAAAPHLRRPQDVAQLHQRHRVGSKFQLSQVQGGSISQAMFLNCLHDLGGI